MSRYLARRLAASAVLLALVLTAVFFLLHLAPGDPTRFLDDPRIPAEQRLRLRALWGLDEPLPTQYVRWLGAAVRGDWGISHVHGRPVRAVVTEALGPTLLLAGAALLVDLVLAVTLGLVAARRPGGWVDRLVRWVSLGLYSTPTFWLALVAAMVFAYRLGWFPPSHLRSPGAASPGGVAGLLDVVHHLALPALVLGAAGAGALARFVRNAWIETRDAPHVVAARARGLAPRRLWWSYRLRPALGPILQALGLGVPALLSGALVVEVVYALPGLGRLSYAAIASRDYPVVLACTAWSAATVIVGTLVADLLLAWSDPRTREHAL